MRVMVLVKATDDSEQGVLPTTELLNAMGRFNEELLKAGIMRTADGLKPSSQGKRITFDGPRRTVIVRALHRDPRAGCRLLALGSQDMDEAVAWVKRCPNPMLGLSEIEIRPLYELADFR